MHVADSGRIEVSVVVPIYNEADNIDLLVDSLLSALQAQPRSFELVLVDDGSSDGSVEKLRAAAEREPRVRVLVLRRNFGQTAAMHAGIQHAHGDVIVTIDGDLQNDPSDIPMMLDLLDQGYDLVHGWRKNRQDEWFRRKLPSRIANGLISRVTGFPIHDLGCTLKVIRREIAVQLELYGEMHRFIPILAHQLGARCLEVETKHHPRRFGKTKYGLGRTLRVVLDLITVKYMLKYFASPMKLFGAIGFLCFGLSLAALMVTAGMKLAANIDMTGNPLLMLGGMGLMMGVQFLSLGLIGEVCARIYFRNEARRTYQVRDAINFDTVRPPLKIHVA
jgi:glycosyltransferase involved in cell wall biosynthesis